MSFFSAISGKLERIPKERLIEASTTCISQVLCLIGGLAAIFIAGRLLSPADFSCYQIIRRIISVVAFPILLCVGIGIPRYAAKGNARCYLWAAFALTFPLLCLSCALSLAANDNFAKLFFGDSSLSGLTFPTLCLIVGLYFHTIIYAYFRGTFRMGLANLMNIGNMFFIVVLGLLFCQSSPAFLCQITGIGWIVLSLSILFCAEAKRMPTPALADLVKARKTLALYGIPRVPGELAQFLLFALPVFFLSHRYGVEQAGMFSFGVSIMTVVASFFDFIGIIILPHLSRKIEQSGVASIVALTKKILSAALVTTCLLSLCAATMMKYPILLVMGQNYLPGVESATLLVFAAPAYVAFIILRNALDALTVFPFNTINLCLTLTAISLGVLYCDKAIKPEYVILAGLVLLSGLSYICFNFIVSRGGSTS